MILQGETTSTPALSKTTFGQASVPPGDMGLPPYRDDDSSSPLAPQAYVPAPRPESAGKRFIKALACGVLAYLVLAVVVKGTVMLATGRYDYGVPDSGRPGQGDGTVRECAEKQDDWTSIPSRDSFFHARTSFNLSVPSPESETFYALTRGVGTSGALIVDVDASESDVTQVVVDVYYSSERLLERASVCSLERGEHEHGVGIFTPEYHYPSNGRDRISFQVHVRLPVSSASSSSPVQFKSLQSDLHNFAIRLSDLASTISFKSVSLATSNGPISAQSLAAGTISARSSNGAISGRFNTSDDGTPLVLHTSNGPIRVEVNVLSNEKDSQKASSVLLQTSNGPLEAAFNLLSSSDSSAAYKITAKTSNSPLNLAFPYQPPSSYLTLEAQTSNARAGVSLHPAYEGTFAVQTSSFMKPVIDVRRDVEDPSGQGRERSVSFRSVAKAQITGEVKWGKGNDGPQGAVHLKTSNAPLTLQL